MDAPPDWWRDFFSGLVVDFWRCALPPEVTRAEARFLRRALALASGARVLDVPCGHGRLAIALAAEGLSVTGVDLSAALLEAARTSAEEQGVADAISWRLSDMRDLPAGAGFDGAFCAGSSFGFLGDEGDAEFLRAVAGSLRPGARFVLDASKVAESVLPAFRDRHELEVGGIRFQAQNRYDARRGRIENRYTITRLDDGAVETKLASHRVYTASQVCSMLESSGFQVLELFGSASDTLYRLGSPQLFALAQTAQRG